MRISRLRAKAFADFGPAVNRQPGFRRGTRRAELQTTRRPMQPLLEDHIKSTQEQKIHKHWPRDGMFLETHHLHHIRQCNNKQITRSLSRASTIRISYKSNIAWLSTCSKIQIRVSTRFQSKSNTWEQAISKNYIFSNCYRNQSMHVRRCRQQNQNGERGLFFQARAEHTFDFARQRAETLQNASPGSRKTNFSTSILKIWHFQNLILPYLGGSR